jgi:hypothetical protein
MKSLSAVLPMFPGAGSAGKDETSFNNLSLSFSHGKEKKS